MVDSNFNRDWVRQSLELQPLVSIHYYCFHYYCFHGRTGGTTVRGTEHPLQ